MKEPSENDRVVSVLGAAAVFLVAAFLAFFSVFIAENVSIWVRLGLVCLACFIGWFLFFASPKTRVVLMRWFPWM